MSATGIRFDPPMWLQRQAWLLEQLRIRRVESVLDVGCGDGTLLSHLMNPAFQLDRFPLGRFPRLSTADTASDAGAGSCSTEGNAPRSRTTSAVGEDSLLPSSHWSRTAPEIVLDRLAGLDVDADVLQVARRHLEERSEFKGTTEARWLPLCLSLFEGSLEAYDSRLEGYDGVVATEVIEHLDDLSLRAFAPMLLGVYQPRLLLVTTPNYDFNQHFYRFVQADVANIPQKDQEPPLTFGYADPTGRTRRRFRHDDHKFEWTVAEFTAYCEEAARDYGYDVVIGGIGEPSEWHDDGGRGARRDDASRYCTQTALFVRQENPSPTLVTRASSPGREEQSRGRTGRTLHVPVVVGSPYDRFLSAATSAATSLSSEMSAEERRSRMARSQMPSHLPWLSTQSGAAEATRPAGPSADDAAASGAGAGKPGYKLTGKVSVVAEADDVPQIPMALGSHEGASERARATAARVDVDTGDDSQPHQLVWKKELPAHTHDSVDDGDARSRSTTQSKPAGQRRGRSRRATKPLPDDAIVGQTIETLHRNARMAGGAPGADGKGAPTRGAAQRYEAGARLWDLWTDDALRAACGGRIVALLDALRLVTPSEAELAERQRELDTQGRRREDVEAGTARTSLSGPERNISPPPPAGVHGESAAADRGAMDTPDDILVGSDGCEWELRVVYARGTGPTSTPEPDLWLFWSGDAVRGWYEEGEGVGHARDHTSTRPVERPGDDAIPASWD